jgi:hypothetical protein
LIAATPEFQRPPRRVAKLYLLCAGKYFGSREGYGLTYTSCQESGASGRRSGNGGGDNPRRAQSRRTSMIAIEPVISDRHLGASSEWRLRTNIAAGSLPLDVRLANNAAVDHGFLERYCCQNFVSTCKMMLCCGKKDTTSNYDIITHDYYTVGTFALATT